MKRKLALFGFFLLVVAPFVLADNPPAKGAAGAPAAAAARGEWIAVLKLNGNIDPISADFVRRGLARAARDHAALAVIELDTPGGLLDSMKQIVESMLASSIPVAVYVAPAGARAASAGVFVAMAAQIAAMAPGTNIGAAHPVAGSGQDIGGVEGEKVLNDAVAKIRSLASLRGRNVDWAERAVRSSASLTDGEAVAQHVVDLEAPSVPALLAAIDGRSVQLQSGTTVLHTAGLPVRVLELSFGQRLLEFLVQPNIAYVLFLLGIIGLIFELKAPGVGVPGVLGGISLLVSLVAFGSLAVNLGGVLLIILSVAFFILDVKAPTHGVLTAGGIIALLVGSFLLFPPWRPVALPGWPGAGLSPIAIVGGTLLFTAFFLTVVTLGVRAQTRKVTSGPEALVGCVGVAVSELRPAGVVRVGGEEWSASALGEELAAGDEVQIIGIEGVHLVVMKKL